MSVRDCEGRWVRSLRDQVVTFTGTVRIDGVHVTRRECEELVRAKNGITAADFSGHVTLLVEGDLDGKHVTDPSRGYSKKLVGAHRTRATGGPHVHVVDVEAFADLLDGIPARVETCVGAVLASASRRSLETEFSAGLCSRGAQASAISAVCD